MRNITHQLTFAMLLCTIQNNMLVCHNTLNRLISTTNQPQPEAQQKKCLAVKSLEDFQSIFTQALINNSSQLSDFFELEQLVILETSKPGSLKNTKPTVYGQYETALLLWNSAKKEQLEHTLPLPIANKALSRLIVSESNIPLACELYQRGARPCITKTLHEACQSRDDQQIMLNLGLCYLQGHHEKLFLEKYRCISTILDHLHDIPRALTLDGTTPSYFIKEYSYSPVKELISEAKKIDLKLNNSTDFLVRINSLVTERLHKNASGHVYSSNLENILVALATTNTKLHEETKNIHDLYETACRFIKNSHRADTNMVLQALCNTKRNRLLKSLAPRYMGNDTLIEWALKRKNLNPYIIYDCIITFFGSLSDLLHQKQHASYAFLVKTHGIIRVLYCIDAQTTSQDKNQSAQAKIQGKLGELLHKKAFSDLRISIK